MFLQICMKTPNDGVLIFVVWAVFTVFRFPSYIHSMQLYTCDLQYGSHTFHSNCDANCLQLQTCTDKKEINLCHVNLLLDQFFLWEYRLLTEVNGILYRFGKKKKLLYRIKTNRVILPISNWIIFEMSGDEKIKYVSYWCLKWDFLDVSRLLGLYFVSVV